MKLAFICGDNLSRAELGGFSCSFGSGFICHCCGATSREIHANFEVKDKQDKLYIKESKESRQIFLKHLKTNAGLRNSVGIKALTSFYQLPDFDPFKALMQDTMHDIPEGILVTTILPKILKGKYENFKVMKKKDLIRRVNKLNWVNGSANIGDDLAISGKAVQKLEFFFRLIEIFPDWIWSNFNYVKLYFDFRFVVFVALSGNYEKEYCG